MIEKKIDKVTSIQQTSGTPSNREELNVFTNNASKKKKLEKAATEPQVEQILNPELNSENDV